MLLPGIINFFKNKYLDNSKPQINDEFENHPRLRFDTWPSVIYAIGDIHGEYELLVELEAKIFADSLHVKGEKWIILIGDLIDRGINSSKVIEHVMKPLGNDFKRISLLGNHELFLLRALSGKMPIKTWLDYGGFETLYSYTQEDLSQVSKWRNESETKLRMTLSNTIPQHHHQFLSSLPLSVEIPGYFFTHAGIRPNVELKDQDPMDLLMIRDEFISKHHGCDKIIVHGHTITKDNVRVKDHAINIDTGAYATRKLTAVKLQNGANPVFTNTQS